MLSRGVAVVPEGNGAGAAGWNRITGGSVRLHPLPGNHFTFFQPPHVERLAAIIRNCLDVPVTAGAVPRTSCPA